MRTAVVIFTIISIICHTGRAFQIGLHPVKRVVASYHDVSNLSPKLRPTTRSLSYPTPLSLAADNDGDENVEPSKAESILNEFHKSNLLFRIVVIGNGAILETTSKLGPTSKSSISPKSGERLLTFASDDQSFEFHVKIEQVCKIAFVSSKRRVARFLSESGTPICSLILVDSSKEGEDWFDALVEEYGNEVLL